MHVSFDPAPLFRSARSVHNCSLPYTAEATKFSETSIVLLAFFLRLRKDIVCTLICCIFG